MRSSGSPLTLVLAMLLAALGLLSTGCPPRPPVPFGPRPPGLPGPGLPRPPGPHLPGLP